MVNINPQFELSSFINPIIQIFRAGGDELKNLMDKGLSEYLEIQTEKYYTTNTFLHRSERIRFDKIYYPVCATYKHLTTDFSNIEELFENYPKITIVGSAGSGKSTLMKYVFLKSISSKFKIPILIELRNLNEYNGDFEKLISEKILKLSIKANNNILKRALKSGKFLFLLDGYDEIVSTKKQEINYQIDSFVDAYNKNSFFITTRPGGGIEGFNSFYDFKVESLTEEDVVGFIEKNVTESERREQLFKIVTDESSAVYRSYLSNPLLLSMFILAFESHPEIPHRKSAFYKNVFDTLYSKHDGVTKNSFPREKLTKLQREDFEWILSIFSYLSLIDGKYSYTEKYLAIMFGKIKTNSEYTFEIEKLIYDLRTSISILVQDGFEYYFPHRSMQEYFAANFISTLDPNKKDNVYNKLYNFFQQNSLDSSFNFWSLCNELDNAAFTEKILIPNLEKIFLKLNGKGKELVRQYFELMGLSVFPFSKNYDEIGSTGMFIFRAHSFYGSILEYAGALNFDQIHNFLINKPSEEKIKDLYTRSLYDQNKKQLKKIVENKELFDLIYKEGILKIIEDIRDKLGIRINYFKEKMKIQESNIDELLA